MTRDTDLRHFVVSITWPPYSTEAVIIEFRPNGATVHENSGLLTTALYEAGLVGKINDTVLYGVYVGSLL